MRIKPENGSEVYLFQISELAKECKSAESSVRDFANKDAHDRQVTGRIKLSTFYYKKSQVLKIHFLRSNFRQTHNIFFNVEYILRKNSVFRLASYRVE